MPSTSKGFFFSVQGGGWEFPAFWDATLLVLALLGDGAYALAPTLGTRRAVTDDLAAR